MLMVLYIFSAVKFILKYDMSLTHKVEILNLPTNFMYFIILSIYLHVMVIAGFYIILFINFVYCKKKKARVPFYFVLI